MRRAYDPSCLRGRGLRRRRKPQQQCGDAGSLRSQCEFAAGDEIELARLAPDFQHHGAECIAGQRVGGSPQRRLDIGGAHGHQQPRIEAQLGEPAHRQRAGFDFGKILPHPDQRPARRHPSRKARDESRRRSTLVSFGEDFMHRGAGEAAAQRRIGLGMAERHPVKRMRFRARLDALDAAAQIRKRAHACAGHAPFLKKIIASAGLK
jgi:hypothetical protein